jgi:acetate kinase
MKVLLLNAGSSSLKCTLMEGAGRQVVAHGLADWAGSVTRYQYAGADGKEHLEGVSWRGQEAEREPDRGRPEQARPHGQPGHRRLA